MLTEVVMPQMGISTLEGKITAWLKKEGDRVAKGESLFEVETDKASMVVESLGAGILQKILAPVGAVARVTEVVAIIAEPEEGNAESATAEPAAAIAPPRRPPAEPQQGANKQAVPRRRLSPLARKTAAAAGLEPQALDRVLGTGIDGAVNRADVIRYLSQSKHAASVAAAEAMSAKSPSAPSHPAVVERPPMTEPAQDRMVPLTRMRRAIADRLTLSVREAPQFWLEADARIAELIELRDKINRHLAGRGLSLGYTDFIVKAVAASLGECPFMNVSYTPGGLVQKSRVHVGFAVALEEGLVVPVIHDAGVKSLSQIAEERRRLEDSAKQGALLEQEISGGTFTVSNLGMFTVDRFVAILNPPEAGILSVGRIRQGLELRDGRVLSTPTVSLGLTVDHRSVDGAQGARFLQEVVSRLEKPYGLVL